MADSGSAPETPPTTTRAPQVVVLTRSGSSDGSRAGTPPCEVVS